MPFSVFINSAVGALLGYIVALLTKPPKHLVKIVIASCGIGNMGNLLLVIIPSICTNSGSIFGAQCLMQGLAYSSYGMLMAVVLMWSVIYNFMRPSEEGNSHQFHEMRTLGLSDSLVNQPRKKSCFLIDSPTAEADAELGQETPQAGLERRALVGANKSEKRLLAVCIGLSDSWKLGLRWVKHLKWGNMITPPVCGVFLAILVGGTEPLQDLFFGKNAWLKLITDVLSCFAAAMIPCMMLVLGGNLAEGPTVSALRFPTIIGISCVRLVILPILGVAMLKIADWLWLLPSANPLFRLVMLLQFAMPSAIHLGMVATMHGVGEKEVSTILFWLYLLCTITIPAFTIWFLYILV